MMFEVYIHDSMNVASLETLRVLKYADCEPFSLKGRDIYARVVNIHDGDTMTCIIEVFPGEFYRFTVRVAGIDTAELKSANPLLQAQAIRARNRVLELLMANTQCFTNSNGIDVKTIKKVLDDTPAIVRLKCLGMDKYNRQLADVLTIDGSVDVAKSLIAEGLAYAYNGGKKKDESDNFVQGF